MPPMYANDGILYASAVTATADAPQIPLKSRRMLNLTRYPRRNL
jgi:hypothetical protein